MATPFRSTNVCEDLLALTGDESPQQRGERAREVLRHPLASKCQREEARRRLDELEEGLVVAAQRDACTVVWALKKWEKLAECLPVGRRLYRVGGAHA